MAQDIREMLKNHSQDNINMSQGHKKRFAERLAAEFPEEAGGKKTVSFMWLKIAATVVVLLSVGLFGYNYLSGLDGGKQQNTQFAGTTTTENGETKVLDKQPKITLGDLSPDFKKVENFYLTGINAQLASLRVTDSNKELIDYYMKRIAELDAEYNRLNTELTETGPTEATINALIDNLKLRLDLLFKLKNKLKELKNLDDEKFTDLQA